MLTDDEAILLNKASVVGDIESAFQLRYPFLKIEFFKPAQNTTVYTTTNKPGRIETGTLLSTIASFSDGLSINIGRNRTVVQVTSELVALLGTVVKISRRSGKVWTAISLTNEWTLDTQNSAGRNISDEMAEREL